MKKLLELTLLKNGGSVIRIALTKNQSTTNLISIINNN